MSEGKMVAAEIVLALIALAMLLAVIGPAVIYCGREAMFWWDRQYEIQADRWGRAELDPVATERLH